MVEMQIGIDVLSFFRKIAIVSDVFKVIGSSFQTLGAATEKACLPKLSFVLSTISCPENDMYQTIFYSLEFSQFSFSNVI